jgi:hypothetical protein
MFVKWVEKSTELQAQSVVILIILMFAVVYARASPGNPNYARAYLIGQETTSERGFEWCADTGCNRFVTNNIEDFLPVSISSTSI